MIAWRETRGETLVEVLMALAIIGLAVTALIAGLATASRSAALHKDHADASTYLLQAADVVKAAAYDATCSAEPYEGSLAAVVPTLWTDRGGSTPQTTVQYWNPTSQAFDGTCPPTTETRAFMRMQLVTVTVTAPGATFSDSISVAKRVVS